MDARRLMYLLREIRTLEFRDAHPDWRTEVYWPIEQ